MRWEHLLLSAIGGAALHHAWATAKNWFEHRALVLPAHAFGEIRPAAQAALATAGAVAENEVGNVAAAIGHRVGAAAEQEVLKIAGRLLPQPAPPGAQSIP